MDNKSRLQNFSWKINIKISKQNLSEETKKKISAGSKGRIAWNKGKKLTNDETRLKMRLAKLGKPSNRIRILAGK